MAYLRPKLCSFKNPLLLGAAIVLQRLMGLAAVQKVKGSDCVGLRGLLTVLAVAG